MREWVRRLRGALGMGLLWAASWTILGMLGVVVFYTLFPDTPDVADVWIPIFAYPGFLAGLGFSVVLRVAEGRRGFHELTLPRFAAWGAVGGLLVGALVAAIGFGKAPAAALAAILGSSAVLGAVSASGSLALARREDDRDLLEGGSGPAAPGISAPDHHHPPTDSPR